jgi:hypothetical protein
MNKKRIPKLILTPNQIESEDNWRFGGCEKLTFCDTCHSNLFYINKVYGVVVENLDYDILGYKEKRIFKLREVGLRLYCAECGEFEDDYSSFKYFKDEVIMDLSELDGGEKQEIEHCLDQYNHTHTFKENYGFTELKILKEKLDEYVKNNPIPKDLKSLKIKK